jgi:hypothetical protein
MKKYKKNFDPISSLLRVRHPSDNRAVLPPTLTIIGLGKRLAKHLTGESNAQESLTEATEDKKEELSVT